MGVFVSVAIIGTGIFIYKKKHIKTPSKEKTVEELFQERENTAKKELETPLAQLLVKKDWASFEKNYDALKQSGTYAQILRAFYIQNQMGQFNQAEQEKLLAIAIETFVAVTHEKTGKLPDPSLLLTQIERLPPPSKNSSSEKTLLSWIKNGDSTFPLAYSLALRKLACQDLAPKPEAIQALIKEVFSKKQRVGSSTLINMVDEMRNQKHKGEVLTQILSRFDQLPSDIQPMAFVVLARNIRLTPSSLRKIRSIMARYLKSNKLFDVESALRSILPLNDFKPFTPEERGKIVNLLTAIPESNRTPFVRAKSEEIIKIFQPPI
jgi:hypothetical protein